MTARISAKPPPEAISQREARSLGLSEFLSMSICRKGTCDTFMRTTSTLECVACREKDAPKREAQRLKAAEERAKARARAAAVKKREAEQTAKDAQRNAAAAVRDAKKRKAEAARRKAWGQAQKAARVSPQVAPAVPDDLDEAEDLDLPPWASSGPPMSATGGCVDAPPWA